MKSRFLMWTLLTFVVIISQGCLEDLPAEESCNFSQNSLGRRISWSRFPVKIYVDSNTAQMPAYGPLYEAIESAVNNWNNQFDTPIFQLMGPTKELPQPDANGNPPTDGYNGIYMITDGRGFKKDEQARTVIHHRGDIIHEADIIINGTLDFYVGNFELEKSQQKIEFTSLMIHELGHVLGLNHIDQEEEPSVMRSRLSFGEARQEIKSIDLQSLSCEY